MHLIQKRLDSSIDGVSDKFMEYIRLSQEKYGRQNGNSPSPHGMSAPHSMHGMQSNQFEAPNSRMLPHESFGAMPGHHGPSFQGNPSNSYRQSQDQHPYKQPPGHGIPPPNHQRPYNEHRPQPNPFSQHNPQSGPYNQHYPNRNYQADSAQSYPHQVFAPGSFEAGKVHYEGVPSKSSHSRNIPDASDLFNSAKVKDQRKKKSVRFNVDDTSDETSDQPQTPSSSSFFTNPAGLFNTAFGKRSG